MNEPTALELQPLKIECRMNFERGRRGAKLLVDSDGPPPIALGRIPRVARLMALALRFERLLTTSEIRDYAALAELGHVTRARITQIMNFLNLDPRVQEEILFLPAVEKGREPIKEWMLRPVAATPDWRKQRKMWREIKAARLPEL